MRVLVCGGRNFSDRDRVFAKLNHLYYDPDVWMFEIIQGGATGADMIAKEWTKNKVGCFCWTYTADWKKYGKAAGPIRNQRMIDEGRPDICVAFPGGKGTADIVRRCKAAGIEVIDG